MFGGIWDRLGIPAVLEELLDGRGFEFPVERAVFASVLHRLFVAGIAGLQLHHPYRAMAWLGEEIAPAEALALAPRCMAGGCDRIGQQPAEGMCGGLGLCC